MTSRFYKRVLKVPFVTALSLQVALMLCVHVRGDAAHDKLKL